MNFELEFWDSKPFIGAAHILAAADEPLRAIQLLENLPGYYRDFPPKEIVELKRDILRKIATASFYATNVDAPIAEHLIDDWVPHVETLTRWKSIAGDVLKFNQENKTPHIIDMGPGSYWLPLMLKKLNFKFTYRDIHISPSGSAEAYKRLPDVYCDTIPDNVPYIFVACEIIEHLHYEQDILAECVRQTRMPDIIHISTPKYSFDKRKLRTDWKNDKSLTLGHLRTYTLQDFYSCVVKMFTEYDLQLIDGDTMHIRALKRG